MDLKIVKHSIDLMINAAMRINSFNIDNVHNLTVYDVDILRELVDDLKKIKEIVQRLHIRQIR